MAPRRKLNTAFLLPWSPPQKKQRSVEDLGSASGDQQEFQMDSFSCLMCILKAQWDNSDNHSEEYCEVPHRFSRSLPELTDGTSSYISSPHASSSSFSDALVRILGQANNEREVACCRAIYRYKSSEGQGMVAIVKVGPPESHLSQIGEGGITNFKILVKIMEAGQINQGPGILFSFDSFDDYARAGLNLKHFSYVQGTRLLRMANIFFSSKGVGVVVVPPIKQQLLPPPPFILEDPCAAESNEVVEKKEGGSWSSLPVLPLLMIMDRLDVFDYKRLTAVCKDWEYAAATMQCPKRRYSVGDGAPWIWHMKYGKESTLREFICLGGNRKFTVDMPEFAECSVISSRGGWILVHRNVGGGVDGRSGYISSWFLVNPFTRDRIEFPKREGRIVQCNGSFTLRDSDGYPDRVVLVLPKPNCQASVLTACPGDKVWRSSHDYSGLERNFALLFTLVLIGDNVYCLDRDSFITVFNVASNSVKVLPRPPSLGGFIAEHKGQLIYVEHGKSVAEKFNTFVLVHRYDEASSSWKVLRPSAVMGTSWYLLSGRDVIAAKGKGLKVYKLIHKVETYRRRQRYTYHYVYVSNLLTGKGRTIRFASDLCAPYWVAIG